MKITNLDEQKLTAYNKLIENYEMLLDEGNSEIVEYFEELFIARGLLLEYFNESSDEELLYFVAINFKTIKKILKEKDTDIYSLDDLAKKILLYKYCDKENLAILGEEKG